MGRTFDIIFFFFKVFVFEILILGKNGGVTASPPPRLLLHGMVFFSNWYHSNIYNVNFTFLANALLQNTLLIWVYTPCKDLYFKFFNRSLNMVWNDIEPYNNSCLQRFTHLNIPTKYQKINYCNVTISIPTVGSLIPLSMSIIDKPMHSPSIPVQCWCKPTHPTEIFSCANFL